MISQIRPAFVALILLTLVTRLVYPLIVTGAAKVAFANLRAASSRLKERLSAQN